MLLKIAVYKCSLKGLKGEKSWQSAHTEPVARSRLSGPRN